MSSSDYIPKPYTGTQPHIFVSYAHKDTDDVYPIIGQLTVDGYRVWYDGGIEPSSDWLAFITNKVLCCEYMLCMISDKYSASYYCCKELELAMENGKKIIPVYLDEKRMEEPVQRILNQYQGIILSEVVSSQLFFEKLYLTSGLTTCYDPALQTGPEYEDNREKLDALKASPAYQLRELLRAIKYDQISSEAIQEKLDSIEFDVSEKADLIATFWKEVQEDIRILAQEESKLKARQAEKESICTCLESYLSQMLLQADVTKVELSNRITFRNSAVTHFSDQAEFVRWAEANGRREWLSYSLPKPNKSAIKNALQAGVQIEGVQLVEKKNIQIK